MNNPFTPGATSTLAYTAVTARVAFGTGGGNQIRIASLAANGFAFFKTGDATVVAAITDTPILPGTAEIYTLPPGHTNIAIIAAAAGSGTMYITRGDGQ